MALPNWSDKNRLEPVAEATTMADAVFHRWNGAERRRKRNFCRYFVFSFQTIKCVVPLLLLLLRLLRLLHRVNEKSANTHATQRKESFFFPRPSSKGNVSSSSSFLDCHKAHYVTGYEAQSSSIFPSVKFFFHVPAFPVALFCVPPDRQVTV